MKPLKQLKRLFLLLCLVVAGAQSAWAQNQYWGTDWEYCSYVGDYTTNGISCYLYRTSYHNMDASIHAITATGDVVVPYSLSGGRLFSIGYWPDQDKTEDVTCTSDMTSLTFKAHVNIHGHFTLENLHGPLTFYGPSNNPYVPKGNRCTTIRSAATLDIPRATALSIDCFQVDGTVNAPALTDLTFTPNTVVNGTINANNATSASIKGTIAGTVNLASVTLPVFSWTGGDCKILSSGQVNVPSATKINLEAGFTVAGMIYAPSATEVNVDWGSHFANYGNIYALSATDVNIETGVATPTEFYGTLTSNQLKSITLGYVDFGSTGKLDCSKLTDIYIPNRYRVPVFTGAYSNHFTVPSKTITVHVYDMSPKELSAMKSSPTWNGFNIVNHQSDISYTLTTDGNAKATLYDLKDDEDYAEATNVSQIAQVFGGSQSGTIKAGHNYAVVIKDVDWDSRKVTLNDDIDLNSFNDQGVQVKYRNFPGYLGSGKFEVRVSDKTCDLQIEQAYMYQTQEIVYTSWGPYTNTINHYGTINYTKYLDGKTTNGSFNSKDATITGSQGSKVTLSIPYNEYYPDELVVNGTPVPFEMSEGVATASFRLPSASSQTTTCSASLTWKKQAPITVEEPVPDDVEIGDTIVVQGDTIVVDGPTMVVPAHRQPQMMVMRSGEGQVRFKGLYWTDDQQTLDNETIEQEANEGAWVWNRKGVINCSEPVTNIIVPDVDAYGHYLDANTWGFSAEITPVEGQTLKTLLLGYITEDEDERQMIHWEDMLYGSNYGHYVHDNYSYVTYNESTNTYTLSNMGDDMNWWIGDYIINIAMGPAESEVKTHASLNFVRKGGRSRVRLYREDCETDGWFDIDEGTTIHELKLYAPAEAEECGQSMNITQQLFVSPVEGEVIHIYCDGRDITSQAWNDEDEDYQLTLERADHTYTILIEDAPDANPTWTILQGDGMTGSQVIVKRKGVDEVTILDDAATTMTIDDVGVEKVTLKVPLGPMQPVETYKIRLVSVTNSTAVQLYLQSFFGMGKARVTNLLGSLPAIIPNKTFATEAEAQNVVDELASKGGTAEIVPGLYGASQPVPNNLPIRVLRNGADFTSQMTFGDPLYAICEVPFATLTDATWEVGFDTSRRQIFYRKGGSMMSDIQYEIYYNEPIVEIPKDVITIVDLPAYGEPNGNLQLNIPVADNEKLTVYRNNVDVTEKFDYDVEEGYRNYFHNGGNVTDLYSITNWGFNTREAATWQIIIEDDTPQNVKTNTINNPDKMVIGYAQTRSDGTEPSDHFTDEFYQFSFDDNDRDIILSQKLRIAVDEGNPIRVMRNGEDVSYEYDEFDSSDGYLYYNMPINDNCTWEISYDTSHRQTVIRKGGTTWNVEFAYDYPEMDNYPISRTPDKVGTPLHVDFPTYCPGKGLSVYIYIDVEDGSELTVLRNGVDVKNKFAIDTNGAAQGFTRYILDESAYDDFDDGETSRLGFRFRDPAVWEITIDDGTSRYDLNNDTKVDISDVTKLVNKVLKRE